VADLPLDLRGQTTTRDEFLAAQRHQLVWIAVDEFDAPVGFIHCRIINGLLHIAEIDVHPDHGRNDIGTRMLAHVLQIATQRAFTAVTLTTFEHLPGMHRYARYGFELLRGNPLDAELAAILRREANAGLKRRVAMSYELQVTSRSQMN
jgi:GNAT superfamily N-acetyltransferase